MNATCYLRTTILQELADFAGPAAAAAVSAGIAALGALSTLFLPETLNKVC